MVSERRYDYRRNQHDGSHSALSIVICKIARSLIPDLSELFGGSLVLIFLGNLYQFPSGQETPLENPSTKEPMPKRLVELPAYTSLRSLFLDEQMIEAEDPQYALRHLFSCESPRQMRRTSVAMVVRENQKIPPNRTSSRFSPLRGDPRRHKKA